MKNIRLITSRLLDCALAVSFCLTFSGAVSCSPGVARLSSGSGSGENLQQVVIRTDVPNKAYFKDIFIDSGIRINAFDSMPAVTYLGWSHETLRLANDSAVYQAVQRDVICGSAEDVNGRLLYPDGEPRFRMIYVNGGLAGAHGKTLEVKGRDAFRTFYANGGSYVGSCAGAYLVSGGTEESLRGSYLDIWPGRVTSANITKVFPSYIIPDESPLLRYYDFGGDNRVDSIKHWNGPYFDKYDSVPGTEVLAINDYPPYKYHGKPSIIAYKADVFSGRAIPCGGHPEQVVDGERRDLMAAMLLYAKDGCGVAKVKGILRNGEVRRMTKSTEDDCPAFTKIGDRQCHHFAVFIPKKARNVKVTLEALAPYHLSLRMAKGTFAFDEDALYRNQGVEAVKTLEFPALDEGTWYIGVQCEDSVTVTDEVMCDTYHNTEILNGVPYTISVSWDNVDSGFALMRKGSDVNELVKLQNSPVTRYLYKDTVVKSISFITGSDSKEGVRIDDLKSEEPIYASVENGILTVSTPADRIRMNVNGSYLFSGFSALTDIRGLENLDTENCTDIIGLFSGCSSLQEVDISALALDKISAMGECFNNLPSLSRINLGLMKPRSFTPSSLFCSKDGKDNITASASGNLEIICSRETADWLMSLNNYKLLKEKGVNVTFIIR